MPLTSDQYKALVLTDLNQVGNADTTAARDLYWIAHEDKGGFHPRLQYLYTKRDVIHYLIGQHWSTAVDRAVGETDTKYQDRIENLQSLLTATEAEITRLEGQRRKGRAPVVGVLTATTPVDTSEVTPNPNDRAYRGDPLRKTL